MTKAVLFLSLLFVIQNTYAAKIVCVSAGNGDSLETVVSDMNKRISPFNSSQISAPSVSTIDGKTTICVTFIETNNLK
jgi:hypothetical protein